MADIGEITGLLSKLDGLPAGAGAEDRNRILGRLMPLVYGELKALARSNRYRWHGSKLSLGTTSLVHEAYMKLAVGSDFSYESRRQFFCIASRAMRSILIDNARWHTRQKRGGTDNPLPLDEVRLVSEERSADLLALDTALSELDEHRPELARIVECRTFGGLTITETAGSLDISPATVKRRWTLAKAWLSRELAVETALPAADS